MKILLLFILFILSCDSDSNPVTLPEDCAGVVGGAAYIDECDICVSGITSLEPCEQDCKGEWGGNAEDIDEDGICDDVDDCIGEYDECGVCNGDGEYNVLDVVMMVNFVLYIEYPNDSEFWSSDLNNDGMVNVLDVVQLVNLILE